MNDTQSNYIVSQISNIVAFIITVFISFMLNGNFVFKENKEERSFSISSINLLFAR